MLIVALVLAVIGLAALVTAVVTSNELIAWVCIAASVIGVVLLIVDALRERSRGEADSDPDAPSQDADEDYAEDYPDETSGRRWRTKPSLPQRKPSTATPKRSPRKTATRANASVVASSSRTSSSETWWKSA